MAGVADDGQVAEPLRQGDGAYIHGEAGIGLEGADAPLAQHDLLVAPVQNVLSSQQPLLKRRPHAPLEHHRLAAAAHLVQKGVVLHVAAADLKDIGVAGHHLHVAHVHHLGDDGQARLLAAGRKDLQALLTQPPESVGGRARFEGAAAQDMAADFLHRPGGRHHLLLGVHRALPGHHHHVVAADQNVPHLYDSTLGSELAAGQLVRPADRHNVDHPFQNRQFVGQFRKDLAHHADYGPLLSAGEASFETQLFQASENPIDLLLR